MAKKVIRNYVPGEGYDFLHFAEIMNLNAKKDFKTANQQTSVQSGDVKIPSGAPTPSITGESSPAVQGTNEVLSGAAAYAKIQQDFKNKLKLANKGMGGGNI